MRDNTGSEVAELKSVDGARAREDRGGDKGSKKQNFFKLLDAVFENTIATGGRSKNLSAEAMMLWWNSVKEFPMEMIRRALVAYMESESGKYMPTPSEIRLILKALGTSVRPGADEAWSMIPISERESAVITDEMMEAMIPAQVLINRGDAIGARMAFKSAYERIVSTNILSGKPPKWVPSFGWDPVLRVNALAQAVLLQKISMDTAVSFLGAPADREMLYEQTGATHLLPPPQTPEQRAAANALLADLKKRLM